MGFPHVIILHYQFRRVHRYNITNPNIPNIFATYICAPSDVKKVNIKTYLKKGVGVCVGGGGGGESGEARQKLATFLKVNLNGNICFII